MTFDFGATKHRRRTVTLTIDGDALKVVYDPSMWNDEMIREELKLSGEGLMYAAVARSLDRLVVEWDAVENDKPLEPTEETFLRIGPRISDQIYDAIWQDCLPDNHRRIKQMQANLGNAVSQNGQADEPHVPRKTPPIRAKKGGKK